MCSFNLVNGTYACTNKELLVDVLRNELGYRGFVMSDWWAVHNTTSVYDGLDQGQPGVESLNQGPWGGPSFPSYQPNNFTEYQIPEAETDRAA